MRARLALGFALVLLAAAMPASARLWKPTSEQLAQDYLTINDNRGPAGHVVITWLASPMVPSSTVKQLLEKYVVLSIVRTRPGPDGAVIWDDVQGVQLSDGNGHALKEVSPDVMPPNLVGMIATSDASLRQSTQGRAKVFWSVWEVGPINACGRGKLVVSYDGEMYSYDTPLPGCVRP